jgi:HEAT repeat protein
VAAAGALRSIQTDSAFEALLASAKQSDARVRVRVISDIGSFYRPAAFDASQKYLDGEKNPDIRAAAIRSLGTSHKKDISELLLKSLNSDSFHNSLADAALGAMRAQDDAAYITPILTCLHDREAKFTSSGFGRALETLAYLGREQEKKEAIREFLLEHVNDKRKPIQLAALGAIGTLGDAKAVSVLETFTLAPKESRERAAAEKSLASLRDTRKTAVELGNLRNEVISMQKENRDLRKQFDDLKKKIEAAMPQPMLLRTNKPATSPKGSR